MGFCGSRLYVGVTLRIALLFTAATDPRPPQLQLTLTQGDSKTNPTIGPDHLTTDKNELHD